MSKKYKELLKITGGVTLLSFLIPQVLAVSHKTAVTSSEIVGVVPVYVSGEVAEKKLGFEVEGAIYNKLTNPDEEVAVGVSNIPLNSIKGVIEGAEADENGVKNIQYTGFEISDKDGDADLTGNIGEDNHRIRLRNDEIQLEWRAVGPNGNVIPADALTAKACDFDLTKYPDPTLVVTTNYIPGTKYGLPSEGKPEKVTQSYKINTEYDCFSGKVAYVKPFDASASREPVKDAANFKAGSGFTLDAGFPTVGFVGANFTLELENNPDPSTYKIVSSDPNVAEVDSNNVIWVKWAGPVTLSIQTLGGQEKSTYSFNVKSFYQLSTYNAGTCAYEGVGTNSCDFGCGQLNKDNLEFDVPTIANLTNGDPNYSSAIGKFSKRIADGSVFGEWGAINKYGSYKQANYISRSKNTGGQMYTASAPDGTVSSILPTIGGSMNLCRGRP